MNGIIAISCILAFLAICHITNAQYAVGFSPTAQVGFNHLNMRPDRGEQRPSPCSDWRNPTSMDKLMAPYAQRMCNQWSLNGNGVANAIPGFGYSPYNAGFGAVYGGNGYSVGNQYGGASFGGYGNPYGGGFGAPVVGYNPFRPF